MQLYMSWKTQNISTSEKEWTYFTKLPGSGLENG